MESDDLKTLLCRHASTIVQELVESQQTMNVLYSLHEENIINEQQYEEICVHCVTDSSKARQMLNVVQDDIQSVNTFLRSLLKLGLDKVAEIFSPVIPKYRKSSNLVELPYIRSSSLPDLDDSMPIDGASCGVVASQTFPGDIAKASENAIHVVPCQVPYGMNSVDEVYKNLSLPRGAVLLINFESFFDCNLEVRKGSKIDVERLDSLFTQMGYNVDIAPENMTKSAMMKKIYQFKADPMLATMDSCVVVIMSHGVDESHFVTSDNKRLAYSEVIELFNNQQCPLLQSKPKIFIFQCCRGNMFDFGVDLLPAKVLEVSHKMGFTDINEPGPQSDAAHNQRQPLSLERSPSFSDMFVILSTVAGFTSFRSVENGSWLIDAICIEFMDHACDNDLENLMKKVSRRLKTKYSASGRKQICELRNIGFDKHFYFNPISSSGLNTWDGVTYPTLPHIARNRRHQSGSSTSEPTHIAGSDPQISTSEGLESLPFENPSIGIQTSPREVSHGDYPLGTGSAEDYLKFARHISCQNPTSVSRHLKRQLSQASDSEADQQMINLLQYFRVNGRPDLADIMQSIQQDIRLERRMKKQKCAFSCEL